jgi:N-formylglutamate amidohydrolase
MVLDDSSCPHISAALQDQTIGSELAKKYASVVAWNVHHIQNARPAKRRKVRMSLGRPELILLLNFEIDCCTHLWDMRLCAFQAACLSSVLVCRLLA